MEKKRSRAQIERKIKANISKIAQLKSENLELTREGVLLSDKTQQFTEQMETIKVRENGKLVKKEALVGRIHWKERFVDEDKPNSRGILIERQQIVRIDGNWNW